MNLKSINPHDQSIVGELKISSQKEIKEAVKGGKEEFLKWKDLPLAKRVEYIKKFRKIVAGNKEKIARLITLEMGKPLQESISEVEGELNFLDYYIEKSPGCLSDEVLLEKDKDLFRITYEPYGLCVCIAPWNFPLSMATSGLIPALIAGNTVILKPSEHTSFSQKMVVELLWEAGVPKKAANFLIGGKEIGKLLVDQPVDLVWFTGSTRVGQEIYEKCGKKFIKSLLEMGGSSPGIIFADADLDSAIENLYWARFLNCGQVCTAVKRLFVQEPIYEKAVNLFADKLKKIKVGNPMDKEADLGPLVSQKQLKILKEQVDDAISKGAKPEIGGKEPESKRLEKGNYFEPTILTKVNLNMRILTEEVFGPVLPIMPFKTEKEAINFANKTEYGLSAEVYTADLKKGERVAKQIEAGTVAINTDDFFRPECPFGGYKKSGMGREYGEIGIKEFSQVKVIALAKN